jgi:hypothetical protein
MDRAGRLEGGQARRAIGWTRQESQRVDRTGDLKGRQQGQDSRTERWAGQKG